MIQDKVGAILPVYYGEWFDLWIHMILLDISMAPRGTTFTGYFTCIVPAYLCPHTYAGIHTMLPTLLFFLEI